MLNVDLEMVKKILKIIKEILELILSGLPERLAVDRTAAKFNMSESAVWEIWKNRK